jgi:hypothetical protein
MSLRIKFLKNPKGTLAVDAEPGEVRWIPRQLAIRLINDGYAAIFPPQEEETARQYETGAIQPGEKAVVEPKLAKPWRGKGRPKKVPDLADENQKDETSPTGGETESSPESGPAMGSEPAAEVESVVPLLSDKNQIDEMPQGGTDFVPEPVAESEGLPELNNAEPELTEAEETKP